MILLFNGKKDDAGVYSTIASSMNGRAIMRERIDPVPSSGPGTSKWYKKPVTTGNTVISFCEKRDFPRSSGLAQAKIYLLVVLVIFDMPSTNHFFWSFCSQVGMTMVLQLAWFSGMFVFGRSELLYRDFDKVSKAQNRADHSNQT